VKKSETNQFGVHCILGIVQEAETHSEERQQQLDAVAVQPGGDKEEERRVTVCETLHRISSTHTHTH